LASKLPLDEDVFSVSEIEALSFVWDKFGSMDEFELSRLTHEYPEWKKHEKTLDSPSISRVRMNFEDFLEDPALDNIEKCYPLTEDEIEDRKEQLNELNYLESLWS